MPFDPSQPFEDVNKDQPPEAFDPSLPFDEVKPEDQSQEFNPSQPFETIQKKGGEVTNVQQIKNEQQDSKDSNAGRAIVGKDDASSQAGAQANDQSSASNQGQVNASNAQDAKQEANVLKKPDERGNVPSVASQVMGTIASPFGYIGEEGWKGIAGVAHAFGAKKFGDYALQTSANAVEDSAKLIGGTPQKEGVGKTIGQVGAFVLEAPLMLTSVGIPAFLAQGFGAMKEDLKAKYQAEGLDENKANSKSTVHAALNTAAAIPAYILGGKIAGKVADKFIADSASALVKLAGRGGINGIANLVTGAVAQGVGAAIEGEDPIAAAKQFSPASVAQAFVFAGHDTGKWLLNEVNIAANLRDVHPVILKIAIAKGGDKQGRMQAELDRRDQASQVDGAKEVGLNETANELEKGTPAQTADEGKGPKEPVKLKTAAFKPAGYDGAPFTGADHSTALRGALENGLISAEEYNKYTEQGQSGRRNGDNFGFITTDGKFVSREEAYKISKNAGQLLTKSPSDHLFPTETGAKLHSAETSLTDHPEVEGIRKKGFFEGIKDTYTMVAEVLDGTTIPNLTRAGVKLSATKHAHAYGGLGAKVDSLLAQVFPDKYKNEESMNRVMDIINKDQILGGADTIQKHIDEQGDRLRELEDLTERGEAPKGAKQEMKDLKSGMDEANQALLDITGVHDLNQYASDVEAAKGTDIEDDINRWKAIIHPQMDELFQKLNGRDDLLQTERGRVFGVRSNLLSESQAQRLAKSLEDDSKPPEPMVSVDYRNPDIKADRLSKKAAFNANYSNDARMVLTNSFASRMNEASKLDFYNDMINSGVAAFADYGGPPNALKGEAVVGMPIRNYPVKNERTGKIDMKEKTLYVQAKLYPEIKQILALDKDPSVQKGILHSITKMQLYGFADGVTHLKNVMNVLNNSLGRDSLRKDILSKIPLLNLAQTVMEVKSIMKQVESKSPKILAELADLANKSGMRPYFKSEGPMRILSPMHKLLHDVDTSSRIIMARRWNNLVERGFVKPSEEGQIDFVNQIGEYNSRLMGRWESLLKSQGVSPFIVAGRAMNRAAKRLLFANPGFEAASNEAALKARAIQVSGLVMAGTIPAIINMMTTGSMFGRAGTPIGAIDFGPDYDTTNGKHRTFDLFQLIGLRRGLRATGLDAAINGFKNGDSFENISRNALNDGVTTAAHPFVGPAPGMVAEVLTGKRIDMRSGYADTYTSRKIGGPMQYIENFRTALKQQNELLYNVGFGKLIEKGMEPFGIPEPSEQNQSETLRDLGLTVGQQTSTAGKVGAAVLKPFATIASTVLAAGGGKLAVSPALKLSAQLGQKQQYSTIQDLRYAARGKIMDAFQRGDLNKAQEMFEQGRQSAVLTEADRDTLTKKMKQPDLLTQRVSSIKEPKDAVDVFRVAEPEEQDRIVDIVAQKIAGSKTLRGLDGDFNPQGKELAEKFKRLAKKGTKFYNALNQ